MKPIDAFDLRVRLTAPERTTTLHRRVSKTAAALQELNTELVATARTDALAGLGNRRRFDEDLDQALWAVAHVLRDTQLHRLLGALAALVEQAEWRFA